MSLLEKKHETCIYVPGDHRKLVAGRFAYGRRRKSGTDGQHAAAGVHGSL
jgi:hypothetical protein